MKISVVYLVTGLFFLFSCRNDKGPLPIAAVGECDTIVYYTDDITPIITAKCAIPGCHVQGSVNGDYTTYSGMKVRLDDGTIKRTVFSGIPYSMPQAGSPTLTDEEKKKLNCWINQGYPDNSKSGSTTQFCTTTISYSLSVVPIISANCSSSACHGASSTNGDYTTYSGLQATVANGELYNRVIVNNNVHKAPAYVPPLSTSDANKINCWIQQNAPDN